MADPASPFSLPPDTPVMAACCAHPPRRRDWFLLIVSGAVFLSYVGWALGKHYLSYVPLFNSFAASIYDISNTMILGVVSGLVASTLLALIPREVVLSAFGQAHGVRGIARAAVLGVLFDVCSHGILMIAARLYERGVKLPHVMAFLVASPWNSISTTFILFSLIGVPHTLIFIVLSMAVAVTTGLAFEAMIRRKVIPENPNTPSPSTPEDLTAVAGGGSPFWQQLKNMDRRALFQRQNIRRSIRQSWADSLMVLRWLFLGIILAALIRTFVPLHVFHDYFGATAMGLLLTLVAATLLEVCSEGAVPIAGDLFNRALAPGNAFAFLMAGVATDYTEIMVLRQMTKSWRVTFLLPLLTVPQVVILGYLLNVL